MSSSSKSNFVVFTTKMPFRGLTLPWSVDTIAAAPSIDDRAGRSQDGEKFLILHFDEKL